MQDLDFRRKRKKSAGKKTARPRRAKKKPVRRGLRFEDAKAQLHFAQEKIQRNRSGIKELAVWAIEILIVCMAAVFLIAAFGQRVSTAGDSMSPVLKNGDVLLINRLIYRVKSPSRGDIVAFRQNENGHYLVKRIVGRDGPDRGRQSAHRRRRTDGRYLCFGYRICRRGSAAGRTR